MTRRVAAVDCGTNSLRLLLADVDPGRAELTDVIRRMEIVRLGSGGGPDRAARARGARPDHGRAARLRGRHRPLGRAGGPDGGDQRHQGRRTTRPSSSAMVKEVLGVAPEVLTGDEEAVLSFTGATAELAAGPDPGPFLVADIGGGSTEFVLGARPGGPASAARRSRSTSAASG